MRRPLFAALFGFAAAVWLAISLLPWEPPDYEPFRNSRICLTGTVVSVEPKRSGGDVVWRMLLSGIKVETHGKAFSPYTPEADSPENEAFPVISPGRRERVLCVLDGEPVVSASSRVRVSGTLIPFRRAMNEGEFDIRLYYHILRIGFSIRDTKILAASAPADPLAASLFRLKKSISNIIDRVFSIENAPVLKAMLAGEKGLLDEETKELYQGAGVMHILSISGLHLSLIGIGLFSMLTKVRTPMPVRSAVSILAVALYGKMTGMGTSAFRALVMLCLFITAKVIGRTYDHLTAAAIASFLLLLDQPLYVLHTGFLFSFSAVLSMGVLLPALPGKALKVIAIPLGTLPVYLWTYGSFPLWSLLINLIVIPLMTIVMLSGTLAVFAGGLALLPAAIGNMAVGTVRIMAVGTVRIMAVGTVRIIEILERGGIFLARVLGLPAELILRLYSLLARLSGSLPGHELILGRPALWQILLYYGMLTAFAALSARIQMPDIRRRIERGSFFRNYRGFQGRGLQGIHFRSMRGCSPEEAGSKDHSLQGPDLSDQNLQGRVFRSPSGAAEKRIRKKRRLLHIAITRLSPRDNRDRRRLAAFFSCIWIAVCLLLLTVRRTPIFEMDFLYVGQGDGIFISSGGKNILIDGGSSSKSDLAKYTLLPFLHCRGTARLDAVILTHDDGDHCSGILELLGDREDGEPTKNPSGTRKETAAYDEREIASGVEKETAFNDEKTKMMRQSPLTGAEEKRRILPAAVAVRSLFKLRTLFNPSSRPLISIGRIFLPDIDPASRGAKYRRIEELAKASGIPIAYIGAGDRIRMGSLSLDCLHPERGAAYTNSNEYSTTLILRYPGFSALLPGDLEGKGEEDLCAALPGMILRSKAEIFPDAKEPGNPGNPGNPEDSRIPGEAGAGASQESSQLTAPALQVNILKVSHHGSRNATSERFLGLVSFDAAVISAGIDNMYGHPHQELLDRIAARGAPCLRTDEAGEIILRIRKGILEQYFYVSDSKKGKR